MTEPVKRGPGRPRVEKMQRQPRVYKLTDAAGLAERFAFSLPPELREKIRRAAAARGVREAEVVRQWCEDAPE
jgi:hypothetical protein